jgi:hypothetical protein
MRICEGQCTTLRRQFMMDYLCALTISFDESFHNKEAWNEIYKIPGKLRMK